MWKFRFLISNQKVMANSAMRIPLLGLVSKVLRIPSSFQWKLVQNTAVYPIRAVVGYMNQNGTSEQLKQSKEQTTPDMPNASHSLGYESPLHSSSGVFFQSLHRQGSERSYFDSACLVGAHPYWNSTSAASPNGGIGRSPSRTEMQRWEQSRSHQANLPNRKSNHFRAGNILPASFPVDALSFAVFGSLDD
jgi:hypothetical protein